MTPRGTYRSALESHLRRDARPRRAASAAACGRARPEQEPASPAVIGVVETAVGQALALAKTPVRPRCAAPAARRRCSRTPRTPARPRRWRSPRTRRSSGSPRPSATTPRPSSAASIRKDEEQMLERVLREIPQLTEPSCADGHATTSPDGTGGAREHRASAAGASAAVKRTRAPGPQGPGRRAGRGPGQGRRGRRERPRDRRATTRSPPTRSTARLPELSQVDLAKVDSYERRHENRTTVVEPHQHAPRRRAVGRLRRAHRRGRPLGARRGRRRPRQAACASTSARTRTAPASSRPPSVSSPPSSRFPPCLG